VLGPKGIKQIKIVFFFSAYLFHTKQFKPKISKMSIESTTRNLEQQIQLGKSKVLEGHTKCINSVCVKDNLIIGGSEDNTIRIWDINSGICLKVLEGHTHYVNSVCVKDNLIISCSWDNTIRIWDMTTGICLERTSPCLKILEGHIGSVRSVCVKDNLIISGSFDKTIRITPISLFPDELKVFRCVIDSYWLARNIELEIMNYLCTD